MIKNAADLYPQLKDCEAQAKQIEILKSDIEHYHMRFDLGNAVPREKLLKEREEAFVLLGCPATMDKKRQDATKGILTKYTNFAKSRIESDSKKTKYIYLAVGIVTLSCATLLILRKRK